jgi:hypothetical protein
MVETDYSEIIMKDDVLNSMVSFQKLPAPIFVHSCFDFVDEVDDESGNRIPSLKLFNKLVESLTYNINLSYSHANEETLKQVGVDVLDTSKDSLLDAVKTWLMKSFLKRMSELAMATHKKRFTKMELFMSWLMGLFGKTYVHKTRIRSPHDILSLVTLGARRVSAACRREGDVYIVCNGKTGTILSDYTEHTSDTSKLYKGMHIYPIGDMRGIAVYVDANMKWSDNTIYVCRKAKTYEPGIQMSCWSTNIKSLNFWEYQNYQHVDMRMEIKYRGNIYETGFRPELNYDKIVYKHDKGVRLF